MTNVRFKPLYNARGGLNRGRAVTDMALVTLGEAQLVTIPGELLPEVSFEIQEHMPGFPRILVGLANDELGYIIPEYDFELASPLPYINEAEGDHYEETNSIGPHIAGIVDEQSDALIEFLEWL
jgi:hypothetical protein